jgi:pullulanase
VTHIAALRATHFVLWRPAVDDPIPSLVIGRFAAGNPPALAEQAVHPLTPLDGHPDVWVVPAVECGLADDVVYHYWFAVVDSRPGGPGALIHRTDPMASTVDWRLLSPPLPPPYGGDERWPAAVVKYRDESLVRCDPGGQEPDWSADPGVAALAPNNRTVYYKLPARWARTSDEGGVEVGVGTFRDVRALVDETVDGANFRGVEALQPGRAYLKDLGVSTLELTPVADSWVVRDWGYATSNYFAPDHDLGFARGHSSPTANHDLAELVVACHSGGIRFGYDAVMAFGQRDPYREVNFMDFHVLWNSGDPEQADRDGFGGDLFKYNYATSGYDPVAGIQSPSLFPSRQYMLAHLAHWMVDQRIDGIRVDSVNNVRNLDFVAAFTWYARELARARADTQGVGAGEADARFLVVGEELSVPVSLVTEGRLEALGNERFKRALRCLLIGEVPPDDADFAQAIERLVDCRQLGFGDCSQAVNYVTSHDVEGYRNERLYDFLVNNGVVDGESRIKLAFACLLTAVGVPLILAGEEFADQHDLPIGTLKQVDPVNYDRLRDDWRARIFGYVARLVELRSEAAGLAVNDTRVLHVDVSPGRRIAAWQRGGGSTDPVVVVANFSDWGTADPMNPASEYVVPGWPTTPAGRRWHEVTRDRDVPDEWVGREPIYPWEAKVYCLV